MNKILGYIGLFAFQVIVLNHLDLSQYIYPQAFILMLIALPPFLNRSWQVVIAFALGLLVDLFIGTPGLHASASMFLVLFRMFLLNRYDIDEIVANRSSLNISTLPLDKFMYLSLSCVLFYHFLVFALESVGAIHLKTYLLTVLISSFATFLIILFIQFFFHKRLGVQ